MIVEFVDTDSNSAHDGFQSWRTQHPHGVFLTLSTQVKANLHGARCQHLGSGPPYFLLDAGFGSLTTKRKICGSVAELNAWATANGVTVTQCRHCLRDGFLDNQPLDTSTYMIAEELPYGQTYTEGDVQRIIVNAYERNPAARQKCIDHHGAICCACGFDFCKVYGSEMSGFIHVHHNKPLSSIGVAYIVDPILDLQPVCPNCHAVIHAGGKCRTIDEVKAMLNA